jgi:hypothetical protein
MLPPANEPIAQREEKDAEENRPSIVHGLHGEGLGNGCGKW